MRRWRVEWRRGERVLRSPPAAREEIAMKKVLCVMALCTWSLSGAFSAALAQEKEGAPATKVPPVVAKVNGKEIKAQEYNRLWRQLQMERGAPEGVKDPKEREAMKQDVLQRLIAVEVLVQKADQMKIEATTEDVEKQIQQVQEKIGGEEAMKQALKLHGLSPEEYRADVLRGLKIQRLLQKEVLDKISLDPKETKEFYESNPEVFNVPEQVRARHILVRLAEKATDDKKKEALQAIQKAAERIEKGEAFETVAKEVSQDGSAPQGGDLGYFGKGQMDPDFEKAAFALEKGKVSQVVETRFGYHLIKVEDRRPPRKLAYEEVEPKLGEFLKRKKGEDGVKSYIEGLVSMAKVERIAF